MKTKEFTFTETDGREVKLMVRQPQYEDLESADRVYASKIASLIRESAGKRLLLRSQVDEFLRTAGVWSTEDEKQVTSLQDQIDDLLAKLKRGGIKLGEGRQIAISIMDLRKEIVRITSKRQVFDDTTIESVAENEKTDYLIYSCTVYPDTGTNYWESFDDMKNDKLSSAYSTASMAVYDVVFNINTDFEKRLPENKWLRRYNFVDEELNYTDRKTGDKVDRSGRPIKVLEEETMKRVSSIQGDIVEDAPFVDDETNEPVTN